MSTESSLEPGWLNKQFSSVRKTVEEYPEWLKKGLGMNEGTRLLTDEEATVLAVDRALTEGWQPSEGSTIEYHCPNLLIEADGTPACKLCFPKAITEMSARRQ